MARLRRIWARFESLSRPRRGPAALLALAALLLLAGVGLTVARGGDGLSQGPRRALAGEGSARAVSGGPTTNGYRLANSIPRATFNKMLGFYPIPGTRQQAVVLTQTGVIWRIWLDGSRAPHQWGDLRSRLKRNLDTEEGLLGLAFSPNYGSDKRVYVHYTAGNPRRSVISRFRVSGGRMLMSSEHIVLVKSQPYGNHNGGQLAFGPSGLLHIAFGDGGGSGDPQRRAQDLSSLHGKILRIDVSGDRYRIPRDNPFVGRPGAKGEILALGFRNPWRFSFDRATGAIWAGDVGQNSWEEVDHVRRGGNYGWSIREGFKCFNGPCNRTGLRAPRAVYSHDQGCSITGGFVYRGSALPELRGWYVYGDYCSGRVWAVNTQGSGAPVQLANTGLRISSWGQLRNGELVAVTFNNRIFRLQRR